MITRRVKPKHLTVDKSQFDASYNTSYEEFDSSILADPLNVDANKKELKRKTIVAELGNGKYLVAKVELDSNSIGTDELQAINKNERKLSRDTKDSVFTDDDIRSGTEFFRFINVDENIIQGATVEITYQFTALNVGEVDYLGEDLAKAQKTVLTNIDKKSRGEELASTDSLTIRSELDKIIQKKIEEQELKMLNDQVEIGKYLSEFYYKGIEPANKKEQLVTTRVRQLVDYVDNDIAFDMADNLKENHVWRNTTAVELLGNGINENALVSIDVLPGYIIQDKEEVPYISNNKNNLVLSVDDLYDSATNRRQLEGSTTPTDEVLEVNSSNFKFERALMPYKEWKAHYDNDENRDTNYLASIELTVKTTIASDADADHMAYDNLGEIVILENTAGRRDVEAVPGNANPRKGEFVVSIEERDTSATELVTFTPPTGILSLEMIKRQSYLVVLAALTLVVVGIVVIKKKVLPKNEK